MLSNPQIRRLTRFLATGLILALLMSLLRAIFPISASAQFQPPSVPDLPAAATTSGSLTDLNLTTEIDAFIPPGLPQSDDPVEGGRGILGRDDRLPMTSGDYPWSAIGRLLSVTSAGETSACTGTLIATDVVLTNAHCVVNPANHEFNQRIYFQPNLVNGQLQNEEDLAIATNVWAATDFRDDNTPPNANDWAVLKLDRPLGDTYGIIGWTPLSLRTLVENYRGRLALVGYSGDFPANNPGETAGVHLGCSILGEYEASLVHDCDTTGGSSGGPILALINGSFQIVAVNSAESTQLLVEDGETEPRRIGLANYAVQVARIVDTLVAQQ